jgi:hypothetical protein
MRMEFRLTYAGSLLAQRNDKRIAERSLHIHEIRKVFHKQLKALWEKHPVLNDKAWTRAGVIGSSMMMEKFPQDGFLWFPMATRRNGLVCKLEILMLREGQPGKALYDIDNRLKTIFDALRKAGSPNELGAGTSRGQQTPDPDENPFYVLLEDDSLITHVAVTTDTLLEPVDGVPADDAVRLVLDVTIRPYNVHMDNLAFT